MSFMDAPQVGRRQHGGGVCHDRREGGLHDHRGFSKEPRLPGWGQVFHREGDDQLGQQHQAGVPQNQPDGEKEQAEGAQTKTEEQGISASVSRLLGIRLKPFKFSICSSSASIL